MGCRDFFSKNFLSKKMAGPRPGTNPRARSRVPKPGPGTGRTGGCVQGHFFEKLKKTGGAGARPEARAQNAVGVAFLELEGSKMQ